MEPTAEPTSVLHGRASGPVGQQGDEVCSADTGVPDPTPAVPSGAAAGGTQRRPLIFLIVSLALFMAAVDQTIVATALPAIQRDLAAPINWSSWIITIYALGQVLMMPLAGRISDQYGRKKVFLVAIAVFTASSLACGLVSNIYVLVVLRAIQALGGGAFMPSATGIVADHFGRDRDRAIGMFTSIFPIGGIVGPILGGLFVATWSWRGIFLINVPIGILLLALGLKFIPTSAPRGSRGFDVAGVTLLALMILSGMVGVTSLGSGPVLSPLFLVSETVAVAAGYLFVRHSRVGSAPFIPIRLLRGRGFGVVNGLNLVFGSAVLGFGALVPLYAENRYGIPPLQAGALLTARAVGVICVAGIAVVTLRRTGYRAPIMVGFLVQAAGLVLLFLAPPSGWPAVGWLALAAGVTGLGMGMSLPASNNATLQLAPDDVSAVAGLRGMFRQGGGIIGVAVTTAILARSADPGLAQAHVFLVLAALLVSMAPLVFLVPEHRGAW